MVKRLLKRFPDLLENIDPSNGWSSLHYAAYNGRYLVCVHLINLGHDKTEILRTFNKNTCVHLSLENGHEQTTHLLLQHFPKLLNDKGFKGFAPIHICVIKDYFKCLEMLLVLGVDINAVTDEGDNSLHLAMKFNAVKSLKLLIFNDIKVNVKNKNNLRPIDVASSFQLENLLKELVEKHAHEKNSTDAIETPNLSSNSIFSSSNSPLKPIYSNPGDSTVHRTHSNSLPPLPSVTTTRGPSVSSASATRSPVARSSISLGFNGSSSNSYTFSPTNTKFQPQQMSMAGSSPIIYSPSTSATFPSIISEESSRSSPSLTINPYPQNSGNSGRALVNSKSVSSISSASLTGSDNNGSISLRSYKAKSRSNSNSNSNSNANLRSGGVGTNSTLTLNAVPVSTNNASAATSAYAGGDLSRSTTNTSNSDILSVNNVPHSASYSNIAKRVDTHKRVDKLPDHKPSSSSNIINIQISSLRRKAPNYDD